MLSSSRLYHTFPAPVAVVTAVLAIAGFLYSCLLFFDIVRFDSMTCWYSIRTDNTICTVVGFFCITIFPKVYMNSICIDVISCDI